MRWRAIVAAAVVIGMATGTSAQKGPDAEKFAAGALREEAKRLGGQLGCYRMLYFLPSDRTDQARLDLFKKATDALEADFSDRVDAHVARFSAPTPVYLRKPLLRMFTWRDIWAVITPEMDRVPFQHPTDADVSSCWMIAAGALDIARENGLLGAETPARRAK